MIVVDTSALLAILFDEPEAERFEQATETDASCLMSVVNAYEAMIVVHRRQGPAASRLPLDLIRRLAIQIVSFDETQMHAAAEAYRRYGKGIHPRAGLNICDCAAYALAKTRDAPLLFKGDDFAHTDLVPAV